MENDFYAVALPLFLGAALAPLLLIRGWDLVTGIIRD